VTEVYGPQAVEHLQSLMCGVLILNLLMKRAVAKRDKEQQQQQPVSTAIRLQLQQHWPDWCKLP
jgi:hypothetical protein